MRTNNIQIYESENAMSNEDLEKNQKNEGKIENKKCCKPIYIILIVIGIVVVIGVAITLFFVLKKKKMNLFFLKKMKIIVL